MQDAAGRREDPEAARTARMYRASAYLDSSQYIPYKHIPYLNAEQAEYESHRTPAAQVYCVRRGEEMGRGRHGLEETIRRVAEDTEHAHRSRHGSDDFFARGYDDGRWGGESYRGDHRYLPGMSAFMLEPGRNGGRHGGLQPVTWREAEMVEGWHMGRR